MQHLEQAAPYNMNLSTLVRANQASSPDSWIGPNTKFEKTNFINLLGRDFDQYTGLLSISDN